MPVIAAGVVNKTGRILVARCFTDVTRIRIEGLLSAFPKLLGAGSKHITFIDSGSVRYLYQPLEGLYLVVVTSKTSNIMEDLATLRLMGRVVPEYCSQLDEETILKNAFEIMFAMDEIVTNGQREATTMDQVLTALEMKSESEERAQRAEEEKKIEAQRVAKAKAKELKAKRKEEMFNNDDGPSNMGGGGGSYEPPASTHQRFSEVATAEVSEVKPAKKIGGGGLTLSNRRKQDQSAKVLAETGAPAAEVARPQQQQYAEPSAPANDHAVNIKVEELISVSLNRDGGVSGVDIHGDLFVTVIDAAAATVKIQLGALSEDFNFKTHPNINKALFTSDNVLSIKDNRPYPTHQALGILRWRAQALGKMKVPLSINAWPSDNSGTIEFELENPALALENVVISMPLAGAFPTVGDISTGEYQHDSATSTLHWRIPRIDKRTPSGSLDVSLNKAVGLSAFFPATVQFSADQPLSGVSIRDVINVETGGTSNFGCTVSVKAEEYVVS